jgi:hypothetical protein
MGTYIKLIYVLGVIVNNIGHELMFTTLISKKNDPSRNYA